MLGFGVNTANLHSKTMPASANLNALAIRLSLEFGKWTCNQKCRTCILLSHGMVDVSHHLRRMGRRDRQTEPSPALLQSMSAVHVDKTSTDTHATAGLVTCALEPGFCSSWHNAQHSMCISDGERRWRIHDTTSRLGVVTAAASRC